MVKHVSEQYTQRHPHADTIGGARAHNCTQLHGTLHDLILVKIDSFLSLQTSDSSKTLFGVRMRCLFLFFHAAAAAAAAFVSAEPWSPSCANLYPAQECCAEPKINVITQQPEGCSEKGTAIVPCFAIPGVLCDRHEVRNPSACDSHCAVP